MNKPDKFVTISARVSPAYASRLREIAKAEDVSVHRIIINLLNQFMDEYEKEE